MKNEIVIDRYDLHDAVEKILQEEFSNKSKKFDIFYWHYPEVKFVKEFILNNGQKAYLYEFEYSEKKQIIIFNKDIKKLKRYFAFKVIAENTKKDTEIFDYSKNKAMFLAKELVMSYHNGEKKSEILATLNNSNSAPSLELAKSKSDKMVEKIHTKESEIQSLIIKLLERKEELIKLKGEKSELHSIKIEPENLFEIVDDHKVIRKEFLKKHRLQYLDLILIDFTNVDVHGIDFRNTNINLDPQTIYHKDLSECNFDGIDLGISTKFDGVNIKNTSFESINGIGTFIQQDSETKDENTKAIKKYRKYKKFTYK